jgi:hypothetical protein
MSNIVTVNSGSAINGILKAGRISISTDSSVTPSSGGKTWYNMINPAGGYTIISDPKIQGYNDGPPIIYPTQTTLPSDILATINGLPDRRGSVAFDNVWDALIWVQSTGKYFILDKTLSGTVTDNIIFAVDFSQPSSYPQSGSTAFDLSGNDNNGTLGSGIGFNSKGWVNFNGTQTSNYNIAVPIDRAELGNNMSIEATFKYEGASGDGYRPIIGGNDPGAGTEVFFGKNTGNTNFGVQDGNYAGSFVTNYNVFDGEWHHMVYTYDNGTGKIYLDGALRNSGAFTKANNAEQIYIGAEVQEGYWWDGDISQVKYYTKTLSSPEILQNYYQSPIVTDGLVFAADAGNLVSYENGSTTAYSLTGSISGSLINGVAFDSGYGGSWEFDGVDDYISLSPSSIPTGNEISISFWNNGDSFASSTIIAASLNNSDQTLNIHLPWSNKNIYWDCGYPFNRIQKLATDAEILGWHNWVFTKNATTGNMSIYLDGALWQSGSGLTSSIPSMTVATLGSYFTPQLYHNGQIAQCLIHNKALTADEVSQNYNANYPRFKSSRDITQDGLGLQISPSNPSSYRSGTIITDLSSNGRDGTLINNPTYLVENGGIIEFDGTDDWIDFGSLAGTFISDPSLSGGVISFSIWTYAIGGYYIMSSGAQTSSRGIAISYQNGSPFISIQTGAKAQSYYAGGNFPTGQWIHWVAVSDNTNWVIYKDGVQISSQALNNATVADAQTKLTIGVPNNITTNYHFQGKIGDVAFWDTALTSQEVSNLFTNQSPRYRVQLPRTVTDSLALTLDAGDITSYPREGTTWYDRSGNGYNGTLSNGPTYSFTDGGTISFDGTDDFIDVTNAGLDITGNFTSEAWVKTDNVTTYRTIISWGVHTTNQDRSMWLESGTGKLCLYFYPTSPNMAKGTSNVADGNWHHCVATWDGTTGRIYVDGVLEGSLALTAGAYTYANTYIGKNVANAYRFAGDINLGKIYTRALSPSEVLENYKSTRSRFGNDGIVTSNLVIHLDPSNINSYTNPNTDIFDLQGNYNGSLINGLPFNPGNGGRLGFDGTNDRIDITGVNYPEYTINLWFKIETTQTTFTTAGHRTFVGSNGFRFQWDDDNTVQGRGPFIDFNGGQGSLSGTTFNPQQWFNKWQMVTVSRIPGSIKLYWNGSLVNSNSVNGNDLQNMQIGYDSLSGIGGADPINRDGGVVYMGDFMVHDIQLTDTQVLQNYNALKNRFGLD